ncbi:hypothetical protein HN011_007189 [Eciton burchellii]|nr:hypothetical protein HN011_007189 [Eciton burchellii]
MNSIASSYTLQKPRYMATSMPRYSKIGIGSKKYGEPRKPDWPYRTNKQTREVQKARIYDDIQRKIASASNIWNIEYPFLNDTTSLTDRHRRRLRMRRYGLISKNKRHRTRMYNVLSKIII